MEGVPTIVAKSVLNSVVNIAATLITSEVDSQLGVPSELNYIKEELDMMQSGLQEISTEKIKTTTDITWIKQVQGLACDAEDCLEEAYVVLRKKGFIPSMLSVKKQYRIAGQIRDLKTRIEHVNERKVRYKLDEKENGSHTNNESASNRSVGYVEALLVGLEKPKRRLIDLIMKEHVELRDEPWKGRVISVVGMGGIGKTTLVRKVYGCLKLRGLFECFAWIDVQHPFNTEKLIESLAQQIQFNEHGVNNNVVTGYLEGKKYLIVLDDLLSLSEWDKISGVLPPVNESRIVVTTRYRRPLDEFQPTDNIFDIKELSKEDAFDLFYKAVYKTNNYRFVNNECHDPITEHMEIQAGLIIEICGRLPLAIVNIGSDLATKPNKTSAGWKNMHHRLSSDFHNTPYLRVLKPVLTSSYDGMPYELKLCLLYLSVFHNHKEIRQSRIIRRWMADGYVMQEEKGKEYFYDLMERSLIQPSEMSTIVDGEVKRCDIHAMMYQLIFAMAVDENIVSLLKDENNINKGDKVRHLVIAGKWDKDVLENVKLSHMRSISIFGEVGEFHRYPKMKMLRVLDLEGTSDLYNLDLRSVGKLRHLRYLGLRGTKIRELPDTLGKLSELETQDIRNTAVVQLPTGLAKLKKLSYLRAGYDHYNNPNIRLTRVARGIHKIRNAILCSPVIYWPLSIGVRATREIGELRSLKFLGMIDIGRSKGLAKELKNLKNLRKLAVTGFSKKNGKTLGNVIHGLQHLSSLVLSSADDSGLRCCLESVSSPPKFIKSLKLYSPLAPNGELPADWISSLENLEKIHFRNTFLTTEIKNIGKLHNLMILYMSCNSFRDGKELCFGDQCTFPKLQVMILEGIQELESVSISKGALKGLQQLYISKCWCIGQKGVSGLEFLVQLKEMEVVVSKSVIDKKFVSNLQDKLLLLPKKPSLRVFKVERRTDK